MSANAETVRGWLLAQPSPEAADEALRTSLQSSLGVGVTVRTEGRYPPNGEPYYVAAGCNLAITNEANVPAAVARLEAAMTPPTKTQAEDWLVMLQTACAGGRRSEVGQAVALELYAGTLSRYPADVARAACTSLALKKRDGTAWFPTLAELDAECERRAGPRYATLHALRRWKPKTEADRMRNEAYDLRYAAKQAEDEQIRVRRSDPDRSSELEEFRLAAITQASELESKARKWDRENAGQSPRSSAQ